LLVYQTKRRGDKAMKYEVQYNPARKVWMIWKVCGYNAEVVKTFKTETSARKWVEKQGA